ncbi:glycosyltransferase family 4 protein [Patulibacter defluvii]|uniref:glycosyltransferase family 4 protein n=1 Tax=Patulibacter defluvii TaxID=3095358 RepID=UPI002A763D6D|nr:glycosyltransferase family 4 protein [Patulibacter sp. DM4]
MSRLRALLRLPAAPTAIRIPDGLLEVQRDGAAPLVPARTGDEPLEVAFVVPSFRTVSGGHTTIANVVRALEGRGLRCSVWILDDDARSGGGGDPTALVEGFRAAFGAIAGPVHAGLDGWRGTDVLVATAWQTVPAALRLPDVAARAYLVQDHEPEFYPTSAEREWAAWTYRQGLHCIVASPWLEEVVGREHGASASRFDIGVDHELYRPGDGPRRDDQVLFYARATTARRGVPLGILALEELHRRRPGTEICLFGEERRVATALPHRHLGVRTRAELADLYRQATVGMVLSLTNPSLIPHEMLACGLPCVDVASASSLAVHGSDGPVALAALAPAALATTIERLLDDPGERERRRAAGVVHCAPFTWRRTGEQVEAGLRTALARAGG